MTTFPAARVLRRLGEPATYTPAAGSAMAIHAKRIGGGRTERVGSVEFVVDDLSAHVLREDVTPAAGDTVTLAGTTWTVGAVEPVQNDPLRLLWALRLTWGISVTWFTPGSTSGSAYDPPDAGVTYTATAASAGASAVTINASAWPGGRIRAGDTLTIGGADYEATANVEAGYSGGYVFQSVPITPALGGALTGGEAVTITPADAGTTRTVRAAVSEFSTEEILAGIKAGDRRIVVRAEAITAEPTTSDTVTLDGEDWTVADVRAVYSGGSVAAWVVKLTR